MKIHLGTFEVRDGVTVGVAAGSIEEAAALIEEAAFRQHEEAERLAREAEERQEETLFREELERRAAIKAEHELFWLPNRSHERWP
jgi:hypothetical protein